MYITWQMYSDAFCSLVQFQVQVQGLIFALNDYFNFRITASGNLWYKHIHKKGNTMTRQQLSMY